jgi:flavin reductase (DIM6/NTAB) family NADH-FMN oxidoreductase RutF
VKSPILSEAYASLECRLIDHKTYGDHTLFVGQVLAVHYSRGAFDDEGKPRIDLVRPVLYLGADWYVTTDAASIRHVPRGS